MRKEDGGAIRYVEETSSKKKPSMKRGDCIQGTVNNIHPKHGIFVKIEGHDFHSGLIT